MNAHAKGFFIFGCLNAALAIALGAAGAHALKAQLASTDPGGWFATAVQYHQIHSLGLILLSLTMNALPASRWFAWSGWLMVLGMALFCGGLYALSLAGVRFVSGGIPAGGMAFILAWLLLAMGGLRLRGRES